MTLSVATNPEFPVAGIVPTTVTASAGNFARLWVTSAPIGSKLRKNIDDNDGARQEVLATTSGDTVDVTLDQPGGYVFAAQEYTRGTTSGSGGGFEGDPKSYTTETQVGSEQTLTIYVGESMSLRVGSPTRGYAELVVYVWNDTIRPTTTTTHGVISPALVNPTTPIAEAAVGAPTVAVALAALEGASATSLTDDLTDLWDELRTKIPLHFGAGGFHTNADTANDIAIEDLPPDPSSPEGWSRSIATMARALRQHFTNGGESLAGASRFHAPADYANLQLLSVPSESGADLATSFSSLATIHAAYEAHRVDTGPHTAADTTNAITASVDKVLVLNSAFISAMAPLQPTAAPTQNPGVVRLAGLGFRRLT